MSILVRKNRKHRSKYQNTYRLIPKRPFDVSKVKTHLMNILELNFKEIEYSDETMRDLCMSVATEIRSAVKLECYDRCRFVIMVFSGEKKMQGVHIYHSFLWDHERDKYAEHTYETTNYYAKAVVYGVYTD